MKLHGLSQQMSSQKEQAPLTHAESLSHAEPFESLSAHSKLLVQYASSVHPDPMKQPVAHPSLF